MIRKFNDPLDSGVHSRVYNTIMASGELQIGEIASLSGVSVDTIRYYEKLKLLPNAGRSSGGFRLFPADVVERIKFIKHSQEMGLSLEEAKQLISTRGPHQCEAVQELLLKKLADLDEFEKKVKSFKRTLKKHLADCEAELIAHGEKAECPVLGTIEKPNRRRV